MRWGAAVPAAMLAIGLTGCTAAPPAPTRAATSPPAAPAPAPQASLTADGAFEEPIVCRSVFDYETVQAAIGTGNLTTVHTAGTAALKDDAAGFAADRAHSWASDVRPLLKGYLAVGDRQVAYYRAVASAKTVDAAVDLQWPDGTDVSTPVFAAIGIPDSLSCPKP